MRALFRLAGVAAVLAIAGCGDPLNRQAVSGTVTFKGKPIVVGSITFSPLDPASKTTAGSAIHAGKYEVASDKGLSPGKYRVSLTAMDKEVLGPVDVTQPMPAAKDMPREILPAKYGAQSTLEADVTSGGDNVFDFKLD